MYIGFFCYARAGVIFLRYFLCGGFVLGVVCLVFSKSRGVTAPFFYFVFVEHFVIEVLVGCF